MECSNRSSWWPARLAAVLAGAAVAFSAHQSAGQEVSIPESWRPLPAPEVGAALDISRWVIGVDTVRATYPWLTGSGYSVAVIDTGVDYTHPALAGRYLGGYDFINGDADPMDDNGHGTHVTGICASDDPGGLYDGMAPGAGYVALKVLGASGSGTWTAVSNALDWVLANHETYGIVSVNLSLGGGTYDLPVEGFLHSKLQALKDAGVFIAAAAGNDYYNEQMGGLTYPGADTATVCVGSTWSANFGYFAWSSGAIDYTGGTDRLVSHGQRDPYLDILAPGAWIRSANASWEGANPDWVDMGGTSMATPHIAGLAVLVRQSIEHFWDPEDWPADDQWADTIEHYLRDYGVLVYDGDDEDDNVANSGLWFYRVDIGASIEAIIADTPVPEPATVVVLAGGFVVLAPRRRRRA